MRTKIYVDGVALVTIDDEGNSVPTVADRVTASDTVYQAYLEGEEILKLFAGDAAKVSFDDGFVPEAMNAK